jgi:hypothetical protein
VISLAENVTGFLKAGATRQLAEDDKNIKNTVNWKGKTTR